MTTTDASPVLHVPARDIPIPRHLSREAQAILALGQLEQRELPALDDLDAWRALIAAHGFECAKRVFAESGTRLPATRCGVRPTPTPERDCVASTEKSNRVDSIRWGARP